MLQGDKRWSEVSPLPGRSMETLDQVLVQLKAVQNGYLGPLYPSVEFGLFGLDAPRVESTPFCLFLNGSVQEILKNAKKNHGCTTAKLKLKGFDLTTALFLVKILKSHFRLRIDFESRWDQKKIEDFLSHFTPTDFEFIEDPGYPIFPFPMASDDKSIGATTVWKPMVRGLPEKKAAVILSSSYESSMGIHQIAALAKSWEIPAHPLGIGTVFHLQDDIAVDRPYFQDGKIYFPQLCPKKERLTPC